MQIENCYYIKFKSKKYPVVGVLLDDKDMHELNNEPCQYLLFGDIPLARALEPFDTKDKAEIDNQIIFYFEDNVCQLYMNRKISEKYLFKLIKEAVLSW